MIKYFLMQLLVAFAVFSLNSCKTNAGSSHTKTDLINNEQIEQEFRQHTQSSNHCRPAPGRKTAIITGFGLFGTSFNISGISTMSMAKDDFWPSEMKDLKIAHTPTNAPALHSELVTSHGSLIKQRTLNIEGEAYEVCFIYLDVQWDLAAATIIYESSIFRPDVIIMSGLNGTEEERFFFESGAFNSTSTYHGFDADGSPDYNNRPVGATVPILSERPLNEKISLTWDAKGISDATKSILGDEVNATRNFSSIVAPPRNSNTYICNNLSYAVTMGMTNQRIRLAGGRIELEGLNSPTRVGFLHYPLRSSEESAAKNPVLVFKWNRVLARAVQFSTH